MSPHARRVLAAIVLLAMANVGAYWLRAVLASRGEAAPPFPGLPLKVGRWQGRPERVPPQIYEYLAPDKLSAGVYRCEDSDITVNAGVVYSRDWRSVHSPALCFTSGNWVLLEQWHRTIPVHADVGLDELPVQELLARYENRRCTALYTFLTPGNATSSWPLQCLRMAVLGRGRGGVLLLLTADVQESRENTRQHMDELLRELYVGYAQAWHRDRNRVVEASGRSAQ